MEIWIFLGVSKRLILHIDPPVWFFFVWASHDGSLQNVVVKNIAIYPEIATNVGISSIFHEYCNMQPAKRMEYPRKMCQQMETF